VDEEGKEVIEGGISRGIYRDIELRLLESLSSCG
jgi:hypothetical protein